MGARHRPRFRSLLKLLPPRGLSRRQFLRRSTGAAAAALAVPLLPACGTADTPGTGGGGPAPDGAPVRPRMAAFLHGVASGDPLADRVVLWSRVTVDPASAAVNAPVAVDWVLSLSPDLSAPLRQGQFVTGAHRDYTVKVDPSGLDSYTTYYYRFSTVLADGLVVNSPIGRTKTAPATAAEVARVRIASAACNSYTTGYFNAFGRIGERADLDLVIHLGDYIYEGDGGTVRSHRPDREILTLADYRERHAQYKTDPDLQAAHRQHPWITTWDDHETTNNSYATGADNHTEGAEGCWEERVGWAIRAYFEWMPIRDRGPGFDAPAADGACPAPVASGLRPEGLGRIYRTVSYGALLDIIVLDTRLAGRALQNGVATVSEEQTILGAEQRAWFLAELARSRATWKLIANGTTFAPLTTPATNPLESCVQSSLDEPCYVNSDAWDGYRFDRNAVFDALEQNQVKNGVFIFGDIHAVIACDLPRAPNDPTRYNPVTGEGSLGVELCCGGVAQVPVPIWTALRSSNPHLKHTNETQLGYLLMDITPERLQGEWYYSTIVAPTSLELPDPVMLQTARDSQRLSPAGVRTLPKSEAPPLAP